MENLKPYIAELIAYMKNAGLLVDPLPQLVMKNDQEVGNTILGPTGYYDPTQKMIVLYIANRHPKDILRSFAHEMIHHYQNLEGKMDSGMSEGDPNYTQNNEAMRKLEKEAYLKGNMMFRDWTDTRKQKK